VFLLALVAPVLAEEYLPSRGLDLPIAIVPYVEPGSFDLMDFREQQRAPAKSRVDTDPHSIFVVKQHVGLAGGWDGGVAHGSVGFYLTVAEWGRWEFRRAVDGDRHRPLPRLQLVHETVVHEGRTDVSRERRLGTLPGRLPPLVGRELLHQSRAGFDLHSNQAGSQFGLSFSRK